MPHSRRQIERRACIAIFADQPDRLDRAPPGKGKPRWIGIAEPFTLPIGGEGEIVRRIQPQRRDV